MINWKIVAIFPIFASAVSILSGAIGGASFLDIILRAFLWAIVFGGIGLGVSFLIGRFFPEFKELTGEPPLKPEEKSADEAGFEAFIPEDNPHELDEIKSGYSDYEEAPGRKNRRRSLDEEEVATLTDADEPGLESGFSGTGASDSSEYSRTGSETDESFELGLDAEELSDTESEDEVASPSKTSKIKKSQDDESSLVFDTDSIDKLPDSFSTEDSVSLPSVEGSLESGGIFSKPYKGTGVSEFEQDPHKTARAVKTMMQRDKEG